MRADFASEKNWDLAALVLEIYRVLRPGGLLIWTEYDPIARDASVADHSIAEKSPHMERARQLVVSAFTRQGVSLNAWRELPLLLDPKNEIWHNGEGTGNRTGFTSMRKTAKMLPLTPWHPFPPLRDAGMIMQQITPQTWRSFIPVFISEGLSESEAEDLVFKMCTETRGNGTRQLYMNYHMLYAFKPARKPEAAYSKGMDD